MTVPRNLRIALACAYAAGVSLVLWLIFRPWSGPVYASDREAMGTGMLILSVPFTAIGAFLVRPYLRQPQVGWWVAYHAVLFFIVLAYIGFLAGVRTAVPEFLGGMALFEFPFDLIAFSVPVALFVASAPLIKRRRERRA